MAFMLAVLRHSCWLHAGPDVTKRFLSANNLDLIVRSHEVRLVCRNVRLPRIYTSNLSIDATIKFSMNLGGVHPTPSLVNVKFDSVYSTVYTTVCIRQCEVCYYLPDSSAAKTIMPYHHTILPSGPALTRPGLPATGAPACMSSFSVCDM